MSNIAQIVVARGDNEPGIIELDKSTITKASIYSINDNMNIWHLKINYKGKYSSNTNGKSSITFQYSSKEEAIEQFNKKVST